MRLSQIRTLFLNIGHFLDHYFMLIFATAAALRLTTEWGLTYAELIPYATPAFVAFGIGAIPAGWLADKWSREGMMVVFFIGIGSSAILAGLANSPLQIAGGLVLIGVFAAIYHPVGLAMVVQGIEKTGIPLAVNGVAGNMGVASAALLTGLMIDNSGWRSAFLISGAVSIILGLLYAWFVRVEGQARARDGNPDMAKKQTAVAAIPKRTLLRIFAVVLFTTAIGGLIFQSTTFALPKVLDERLGEFAGSATLVGWYAFLVFSFAALAQLVVGYLVDHYSLRTVFAVIAILQSVFFALMVQLSGIAALLVSVAFMLVVFGQIPINDVLVGRVARSEWRSRAYALRYVVTFSVSASAVPVIAWVHGTWGFERLFVLLSVAAMLIFIIVLALPKPQEVVHGR